MGKSWSRISLALIWFGLVCRVLWGLVKVGFVTWGTERVWLVWESSNDTE